MKQIVVEAQFLVEIIHGIDLLKGLHEMTDTRAVDILQPDLVTGLPDPFMEDGYVRVPEKPELGIELNEEVIREHTRYGGYLAHRRMKQAQTRLMDSSGATERGLADQTTTAIPCSC